MRILAPKILRNISPSDVVWTGVVVLWCGRGGPVVEFFLEEIFLGILYSNFLGPVVEFFLK